MRTTPLIACLLSLAPLGCQSPGTEHSHEDPSGDYPPYVEVRNWRILSGEVAGSGQPTLEQFDELAARGYGTVVNLRTPGEIDEDAERAAVEAAGMRYLSIPVSGSTMELTDAAALREALGSANSAPVLVHCGSGGRVAVLWGLYQGFDQGLTPEQAKAASQRAGYRGDWADPVFARELRARDLPPERD